MLRPQMALMGLTMISPLLRLRKLTTWTLRLTRLLHINNLRNLPVIDLVKVIHLALLVNKLLLHPLWIVLGAAFLLFPFISSQLGDSFCPGCPLIILMRKSATSYLGTWR
jgi:hypothetical protein